MLAAIRPDDWNLPLLVHVAGAMVLVGALVVVVVVGAAAARSDAAAPALTRLGLRALLLGALPGYVVMRGGAEWIASESGVGDATWIGIGYATADGGLLLTLVAIALAWRADRRLAGGAGAAGSTALVVVSGLVLAAAVIAIWAMTTKSS